MKPLDILREPRIAELMDLLGSLGRDADPHRCIERLVAGVGRCAAGRAYAEVTVADDGGRVLTRLCADGQDILGGKTRPVGQNGLIDRLTATPVPKVLHQLVLDDPTLPTEMAGYRAVMAIPVFAANAARDWVILFDRRPDGFSAEDVEHVLVRTSLVRAVIENLDIARQLFEANLKIQQEIAEIASIQRALLPPEPPCVPGLKFACSYNTAGQAGGDLYDLAMFGAATPNPALAILVGDVSGHGPAAAVVMAMLHSILHAFPQRPAGPAELLQYANRHLCDKNIGRSFVTAFLGFYDPATHILIYARAGHNPPLLATWDPAPRFEYLEAVGNLPLGITPDVNYAEATLVLRPGQLLALYTDGITEAKGPGGGFFDTKGLEAAIARAGPRPQAVVDAVRSALYHHTGGFYVADDQTLVAVGVD